MLRVFWRFIAYGVTVFAIAALVVYAGTTSPAGFGFERVLPGSTTRTSEFSVVEMTQALLLLACLLMFTFVALRDSLRRPMAISIATVLGVFLVREQGFFFKYYLLANVWQVICAILVAAAAVYCVRNRLRWQQGWRRSWPSTGLGILLAGIILLLAFAQLMGTEMLWQAVLGDSYVRVVKIAAEEFIELGAYLLMSIGSFEFLYAWSRLPRSAKRAPRRD